jgi:hypothetical protein
MDVDSSFHFVSGSHPSISIVCEGIERASTRSVRKKRNPSARKPENLRLNASRMLANAFFHSSARIRTNTIEARALPRDGGWYLW